MHQSSARDCVYRTLPIRKRRAARAYIRLELFALREDFRRELTRGKSRRKEFDISGFAFHEVTTELFERWEVASIIRAWLWEHYPHQVGLKYYNAADNRATFVRA